MTWLLLSWLLLGQTGAGSAGPGQSPVIIYAVGDIAVVGNAELELAGRYHEAFARIQPLLADRDAAVCNLEAPLTRRGSAVAGKTFTFRAPPESLAAVVAAGFNVFGLANNHMLDYGPLGLQDTLAHLHAAGVYPVGAGADLAAARRPAIVPLPAKASAVAVLAYSMTFPEEFFAAAQKAGTAPGNLEYVEQDVRAARKGAPIVVVSAHWSAELLQVPKDYQRESAVRAIDQGARLVLGHHPHVLQGVEFYRGGVIFYSLGNFAFGSYSAAAKTSIIARVEFSPDGQLLRAEAIPLWVFNPEVNFRPRPLAGAEGEAVARELRGLSAAFGTQVEYEPHSGRITFLPPREPPAPAAE